MKKLSTLFLTICMCLAFGLFLTGCGKNDSSWENYFVFENVTVTQTVDYTDASVIDTNTTLFIADDKWTLETTYSWSDGSWTDKVYFDGSQMHSSLQGNNTEDDYYMQKTTLFNEIDLFSHNKSAFQNTDEGVYEADNITLRNFVYTSVKIIIVDDLIQSIKYVCSFESDSQQYVQNVELTFSNWGQTQVTWAE